MDELRKAPPTSRLQLYNVWNFQGRDPKCGTTSRGKFRVSAGVRAPDSKSGGYGFRTHASGVQILGKIAELSDEEKVK
jgi:hypothetical protein